MKKFYFLFGISLLSLSTALGQSNRRDGEEVDYCKQHIIHNQLMNDPAYAAMYNAGQAEMAAREEAMRSSGNVRGVIYKIPVVFHVLHQGGDENISREQIMDALDILNRDYRLQNSDQFNVHDDFKASNPSATCKPSDVEIEFVLATKAPNGTCFGGITRTYSLTTNNLGQDAQGNQLDNIDGEDQINAILTGNDIYQGTWPANKYLNVIIAKSINGAAGYTYNPGIGTSMNFNSIWMLHNYTGSIGTSDAGRSRALTHEVGHWLNLSHTWGGTNEPGTGSCGSDQVADTPVTQGVTSCNLNEDHCGPRANVENYMDYSYCSKMFSAGQVTRMRAAITSSTSGRNNIWTPANLTSVGADGTAGVCAAKFNVDRTAICSGEQVTFTDESYNEITGWSWVFEGGTPATSTLQNPVVTFTTAGPHDVTLTVTDGSGTANVVKADLINVLDAPSTLPFLESFESLSAITDNWIIENPGSNAAWTLATNTGSSGTKSAKLGNVNQPAGNTDELVSNPVDLSDVNSTDKVTLSFRYAYRKKASGNNDFLKILVSKDCGDSWDVRKTMTATQLSSTVVASDWTPASTDFITVHMTNITSTFWVEDFRYKFQFISGGGNNIYLDDINIYEGAPSGTVVVGLDEIAEFDNAVVFPNPAEEQVNVRFTSPKGQKVVLTITDLTGKILQEQVINAEEGSNLAILSTDQLASGMYLIRFNNGGQTLNFMVK